MESTIESPRFFSFPDPVNEVSARLVAAGVVAMTATAIVFDQRWLVVVLAYGFVACVAAGPRLSPLGLVVTRVITPRLAIEPRSVPGPPKRFAQAIGATFSLTAAVLTFGAGNWAAAQVVLGLLAGAAFLEAGFGLCLGCVVFAGLMRTGVIHREVCERCADLWAVGAPAQSVGSGKGEARNRNQP